MLMEKIPDTEEAFLAAFDRREAERGASDIGVSLAKHTMVAPEEARVAAIIARDQAERIAEHDRKRARIEVGNGSFVNLADTVLPPTPEWLAKGEVKPFTPRLIGEGGRTETVKTVRTVRRVLTPIVMRMHMAGKISDEQFGACMWYRALHDAAGLTGRYKTSNLSLAGNVGGGCGGAQHPHPQHHAELEAREAFRDARDVIKSFYLRFFEAVVIDDIPLRRATRFARCRDDRAPARFRDAANEVVVYWQRFGVKSVSPE